MQRATVLQLHYVVDHPKVGEQTYLEEIAYLQYFQR